MRKKLALAIIGIAIYLLTLFFTAPVAIFYHWFIPGQFQVTGIEGTLFHGWVEQLRWPGGSISNLHWRVYISRLLLGQFQVDIHFSGAIKGHSEVTITPWGWRFNNTQISTRLSTLKASLPIELPVNLSGQLSVNLSEFEPGLNGCEKLDGRIMISDVQVSSELGEFHPSHILGQLRCKNHRPDLQIDHRGPMFRLNMHVQRQPQQWLLEGRFKPTSELPKAYRQLLRRMTLGDNQGYHYFHLTYPNQVRQVKNTH
ncbi:MAG: Type II secretion system protein N [Candidatus Celerinatantimonas neptuna]|nr:MAG: Type II secretion system protein N [Candidatus Celerinatantimonas neptuna]